jgi:hypothetical protein
MTSKFVGRTNSEKNNNITTNLLVPLRIHNILDTMLMLVPSLSHL